MHDIRLKNHTYLIALFLNIFNLYNCYFQTLIAGMWRTSRQQPHSLLGTYIGSHSSQVIS